MARGVHASGVAGRRGSSCKPASSIHRWPAQDRRCGPLRPDAALPGRGGVQQVHGRGLMGEGHGGAGRLGHIGHSRGLGREGHVDARGLGRTDPRTGHCRRLGQCARLADPGPTGQQRARCGRRSAVGATVAAEGRPRRPGVRLRPRPGAADQKRQVAGQGHRDRQRLQRGAAAHAEGRSAPGQPAIDPPARAFACRLCPSRRHQAGADLARTPPAVAEEGPRVRPHRAKDQPSRLQLAHVTQAPLRAIRARRLSACRPLAREVSESQCGSSASAFRPWVCCHAAR
mmetsp:Transcript_65172/g.210133  ORF Transcript_65172/g.210133 Transcript_65172/m.210133 type:complete len:286 (-) Transcript_65172:398-1255(-)